MIFSLLLIFLGIIVGYALYEAFTTDEYDDLEMEDEEEEF